MIEHQQNSFKVTLRGSKLGPLAPPHLNSSSKIMTALRAPRTSSDRCHDEPL